MTELMSPSFFDSRRRNPDHINLTTTDTSQFDQDEMHELFILSHEYGGWHNVTVRPHFGQESLSSEQVEIPVPESVRTVCQKIRSLGGRALIVGGAVRDAVLSSIYTEGTSIMPKDIDLEVYGIPPNLLYHILLTQFGESEIDAVGKSFGVLKVRVDGLSEPLDIATPRRDSKTGQGHKGFAIQADPGMTIQEAARRRDLTFNAMLYDPLTERIYDPYRGMDSVRTKQIEITDEETFREDPLRVLRVMQFAARFGFTVSEQTTQLCRQMVAQGELDTLPKERIREEVLKLLNKSIQPSLGLQFARETGITERYWGELHALIDTPQDPQWHPEGNVWTHTLQVVDTAAIIAQRENLKGNEKTILMLAALCHDLGKPFTTKLVGEKYCAHGHEAAGVEPSKSLLSKIDMPKDIKKAVLTLVPEHMLPPVFFHQAKQGANMTSALNRLAARLTRGDTNISMLMLLAEADQRGRNGQSTIPLSPEDANCTDWQEWLTLEIKRLEIHNSKPREILPGRLILQALGVKGGPHIGVIQKILYTMQLDGDIKSQEDAIQKARYYYDLFVKYVLEQIQRFDMNEHIVWTNLVRMDDPRVILEEKKEEEKKEV